MGDCCMLRFVPHPRYVGRGSGGHPSSSAFGTNRLVYAGPASEMDPAAGSMIRRTGFEVGMAGISARFGGMNFSPLLQVRGPSMEEN